MSCASFGVVHNEYTRYYIFSTSTFEKPARKLLFLENLEGGKRRLSGKVCKVHPTNHEG